MAFAKCVKAKDVLGSTAQREVYVKMRATCDWISTSGCESSWTSRLCSWEDSSNMTRYRQSCLRLSSWATWAQGLQAFRFPANISNRRSTAGAVRESKSSTTDAGAYVKKEKRPSLKWGFKFIFWTENNLTYLIHLFRRPLNAEPC